ncbi:fibroblast growth factor 4A-like isoform X2 [Oryzias latipes]
MNFTVEVPSGRLGLLLLLLGSLCPQLDGAKGPEQKVLQQEQKVLQQEQKVLQQEQKVLQQEQKVLQQEQSSHIPLWKIHMRDSLVKGRGRSLGEPEVIQEQLLYCRVGIGFHLQILPGGSVRGVHRPTQYSWLKLFSIRPGLVAIRGLRSGLFLCMSRDGWAHGAEKFSDDCIFKENLEENHYTTYSSYSHPGNYLALSRKGELRRGGSANRNQASTHFLPRRRLW